MNIEKTIKNLKLRGFEVSFFENKEAASDYLLSQIKNTTVGIGGCLTADQMGLYEKLIEAGTDVIGGNYDAENIVKAVEEGYLPKSASGRVEIGEKKYTKSQIVEMYREKPLAEIIAALQAIDDRREKTSPTDELED